MGSLRTENPDKMENNGPSIHRTTDMKSNLFLILSFLIIAGCSGVAEAPEENLDYTRSDVFHARFENVETKTLFDNSLRLLWNPEDRISVFKGTTVNRQYRNKILTIKNYADFLPVEEGDVYHSGSDLANPASYAIYPYSPETYIDESDCYFVYTLPTEQEYAVNSFGIGANVMVAVTEDLNDYDLSFKNVGGYLAFSVYGDGSVIKSVRLSSREGEPLAGNVIITASHTSLPSVSFIENANRVPTLTLDCGDGVELGASADEAKAFWFVVPPTTYSNGFAISFENSDRSVVTRTVSGSRTVLRNKVYRIGPFEVVFDNPAKSFSGNGIDGISETGFQW